MSAKMTEAEFAAALAAKGLALPPDQLRAMLPTARFLREAAERIARYQAEAPDAPR